MELRDVFLWGTDQPEVDQLDQSETRRVPPQRRKRVKLAVVVPDLELVASELILGVLLDNQSAFS